ncbi:M55 family metallopeptidase [Sphingopyxis panaciterrae]
MRRLFISVDMEGVAGVASAVSLMPTGWEYTAYRRWMTAELNSVAEAAFEAGYDEVIAADGHGNGHNVDPDLLVDNIQLVRSWPRPLFQMQMIDDPSVDACAFVGYHSAAGTADSVLAHSFSGAAFRSIRLNGEVASEGYINAAVAGGFGKPVLFVSGDQQTLDDARRYAPDAVLHATKQSFGFKSAVSLPPRQACQALKEAAARAFAQPRGAPFRLEPPFEVEIEMTTLTAAEMLGYLPWLDRIDAYSLKASFASMEEATGFIGFAALYMPNGQSPF